MVTTGYDHIQHGRLHYIFHVGSVLLVGWALLVGNLAPALALTGVALLLWFIGMTFHSLQVRADGDALVVRFGPLPLMRKRIPFAEIEAVERDRTRLIDGWGVHFVPWRGWTWNIWGWECARLTVRGKTLRIGSDDVDNLVSFLRGRVPT